MEQHVAFEEIAAGHGIERDLRQRRSMDRGKAVGGIENVPIAAGELGEKRQAGIAEQPGDGHRLQVTRGMETVALGVVGLAGEQGTHQRRQQFGGHLAVAVDLDDDFHAVGQRLAIALDHGTADAAVVRVAQDCHPRVRAALGDMRAGLLRTGVIDAVDPGNLAADPGDDAKHAVAHAVAGNDDGNGRHRGVGNVEASSCEDGLLAAVVTGGGSGPRDAAQRCQARSSAIPPASENGMTSIKL